MRNTILSAWGKIVNYLGFACLKNVDVRPQVAQNSMNTAMTYVYNHSVVPVFTNLFPQFYPQAKRTQLHLLIGLFSPLSTIPITTTTNLKSKER